MNNANNISKAEKKKHFEDMMSDLQEIAELTSKSMQLQTDILDLLKSDDLNACKKIEKLQGEHEMLNQKITHLKNVFDKKYPTEDKEWELDERIKS